jgi:hypothetical protein
VARTLGAKNKTPREMRAEARWLEEKAKYNEKIAKLKAKEKAAKKAR